MIFTISMVLMKRVEISKKTTMEMEEMEVIQLTLMHKMEEVQIMPTSPLPLMDRIQECRCFYGTVQLLLDPY